MTRKDYAAYQNAVQNFMTCEGINHLSTSHLKCPDCDVEFDSSECPKCGKDAGSFPLEPYISSQRCDCCGDALQGDRMDAHSYCEATKEIKEYVICTDCEYFAEHGCLDDMTMAELEADQED